MGKVKEKKTSKLKKYKTNLLRSTVPESFSDPRFSNSDNIRFLNFQLYNYFLGPRSFCIIYQVLKFVNISGHTMVPHPSIDEFTFLICFCKSFVIPYLNTMSN